MKTSVGLVRTLVLATVIGVVSLSGCGGEVSFTTAKLSEATMCLGVDTQNKPVNATNSFGVNTPEIFCSAKLSNAPDDTEVLSEWVYVKGEVAGVTDYIIDTLPLTADGTQYLQFSMPRPDGGWPIGEYKLNLYVDGKDAVSLPFTVSRTATGPGPSGAFISEATLALSVDAMSRPVDPTNVFRADTPEFICSVLVSNAPAGTELLSEWYYVSGEWQGVTNRLVGSVPFVTQGTQYIALSLTMPDEGWPAGKYQVKLYLNGALQEAVPFDVESAPLRAVMAMSIDSDNNPVNPTTVFPVGVEKVYTVIYVSEAPASAKLLAEWYEVGGTVHALLGNYEMDITARERPTWVNRTYGTGGWPPGSYAVVLSVNGVRQIILPFTVQ